MKYSLIVESRAKKDLEAFDQTIKRRIIKKLKYLMEQEDPIFHAKKLTDSNGGDYRWRIGHYRFVFDVENNVIKLLRIQHRKDVYKR